MAAVGQGKGGKGRGAAAPDTARLKSWLREAGLRITAGRVAILAALENAGSPLTHAALVERIGGLVVDRATVYRGLADLVEAKLVTRTDLGDHVWRFELRRHAGTDDVHPHFVCTRCGDIRCLPAAAVQLRAVGDLEELSSLQGLEVHVRGVCARCQGAAVDLDPSALPSLATATG